MSKKKYPKSSKLLMAPWQTQAEVKHSLSFLRNVLLLATGVGAYMFCGEPMVQKGQYIYIYIYIDQCIYI